jgi:hypothetical protein
VTESGSPPVARMAGNSSSAGKVTTGGGAGTGAGSGAGIDADAGAGTGTVSGGVAGKLAQAASADVTRAAAIRDV